MRGADPDPGGRSEDARPIEEKRAELAAISGPSSGSDAPSGTQIRAIGDNTGSMALKGANPAHEGAEQPDRWALDEDLAAVGDRWGIDPDRLLASA